MHNDENIQFSFSPPKAFDRSFSGNDRFYSINQVEQFMKITFDNPQVDLGI